MTASDSVDQAHDIPSQPGQGSGPLAGRGSDFQGSESGRASFTESESRTQAGPGCNLKCHGSTAAPGAGCQGPTAKYGTTGTAVAFTIQDHRSDQESESMALIRLSGSVGSLFGAHFSFCFRFLFQWSPMVGVE